MKIAVTGHTSGIGKSIYKVFEKNGHQVEGFSLSNGFNIATDLDKIVDKILEFDVFVNNAYHPTGQYALLEKVYSLWTGQNKSIINVSSKQSRRDLEWSQDYIDAKRKQNIFIDQKITRAYPKILNVLPGLTDTLMAEVLESETKMNPDELADLVYYLWSHPKLHIQEITVDALGLDWQDIKVKHDT